MHIQTFSEQKHLWFHVSVQLYVHTLPAVYAIHLRPRFLVYALNKLLWKTDFFRLRKQDTLMRSTSSSAGMNKFSKNLEAFSKFWGPKEWSEEVPIWGPRVIRRRCTKFSHPGIFHSYFSEIPGIESDTCINSLPVFFFLHGFNQWQNFYVLRSSLPSIQRKLRWTVTMDVKWTHHMTHSSFFWTRNDCTRVYYLIATGTLEGSSAARKYHTLCELLNIPQQTPWEYSSE
jgi:hypothetical protein